MNLLCFLFGHKPPVYEDTGWWSPGERYAKLSHAGTDGVGREHAAVIGKCARCGQKFEMARVHLTPMVAPCTVSHTMDGPVQTPPGFQVVSEHSIGWLHDNHLDAYEGFYNRIDKTSDE